MHRSQRNHAAMNRMTIFIVDDHPVTRRGIADVINERETMCVCGEAGTIAEAIQGIIAHQPDIALVDISLEKEDGFGLITALRKSCPNTAWIIISMHDDIAFIHKAFQTGVRGYIHKSEDPNEYPDAVAKVYQGELFWSKILTPHIELLLASKTLQNSTENHLTKREQEVFILLTQNKDRQDIADSLCVATSTVNAHIENIKRKLSLSSFSELQLYVQNWLKNNR